MKTSDIEALTTRISGEVTTAGHPNYETLKAVFNKVGAPALIVSVESTSDVVEAVKFAAEHKLEWTVRSGGHGLGGQATNEGGLMIDLSQMRAVKIIDPKTNRVKVETGATWGEVAAALQPHNLAITSGDTGSVGVGGLTLGGGIGWMVRKYGMTIDRLKSAEVVTKTGKVLTVSEAENAELFWALRGAGHELDVVVTSFEFEAHPGGKVVYAQFIYNVTDGANTLRRWADICTAAPNELTSIAMILPPMGQQPALISVTACFARDDTEAAIAALEPLTQNPDMIDQSAQLIPYSALVADQGRARFHTERVEHRTGFFKELSEEIIENIMEHYGKLDTPALQLRVLGGAFADVSNDATAFAHRDNLILASSIQLGGGKNTIEAAWAPLRPFVTGIYVNFADEIEDELDLVYPATAKRITLVKNKENKHG